MGVPPREHRFSRAYPLGGVGMRSVTHPLPSRASKGNCWCPGFGAECWTLLDSHRAHPESARSF